MRISDWSSDVCSSDLKGRAQPLPNPLRLPIRHIFGAPKGEMFQKMSETKLAILLHQRSHVDADRSEEHTSELQSLMRISYAVFCLKKKIINIRTYDKTSLPQPHSTKTSSPRTHKTTSHK